VVSFLEANLARISHPTSDVCVCVCVCVCQRGQYPATLNLPQHSAGHPRGIKVLISGNARATRLDDWSPRANLMATTGDCVQPQNLKGPHPCHFHHPLSVFIVTSLPLSQRPTESNYDINIFVNCKM